jgi:hypothetical protein
VVRKKVPGVMADFLTTGGWKKVPGVMADFLTIWEWKKVFGVSADFLTALRDAAALMDRKNRIIFKLCKTLYFKESFA